jgi:S1-C subfamily serine protease
VEPGDVLWLRVATDTDWRLPILGSASAYNFYAGWNTYGWPSSLTNDEFVAAFGSRLRGLWVKDVASGRFVVYAPGLDGSEQALSLVTPFAPVWVLLSDGPRLTVGLESGIRAELLPSADASSAIPIAQDATEVERAIVRVQASGLAGSGFIVAEDLVLTSAHLIELGEQVALRYFDGARASGQVTALNEALDLAVIRVAGMPDTVRRLDWESASDPALTTAIWVWGFPLEGNLIQSGFSASVSVSVGFISAMRSRAGVAFLQTDAAMNPGNSGGAITLRDGRVIGVATATFSVSGDDAEGIHFALDLTAHRRQVSDLLKDA